MSVELKQCSRCVMDETAADISFNDEGACNYCCAMLSALDDFQPESSDKLQCKLSNFIAEIKKAGNGKRYDCIVGVSGGADSAYALFLAKQHGLRPLAVHMDNGWNSELAVNNIENLVRKLDVDLYTHVVEWREYRSLQQAFFDADVIDVELLYDNAMLALNYRMAVKYGVKYILSGSNTATEGMRVPSNFNWNKYDRKNIIAIAKRSGASVRSLPMMGVSKYIFSRLFLGVRWVPFLDYIEYDKQRCIDFLVRNIGYRPYPYKHYESIFTRFYQGYLLPNKFGVDKRKLHFSSLICSGQMTRTEALERLKEIPYADLSDLESDIEYFQKKMRWSPSDLQSYLSRPEIPHDFYTSEAWFYEFLRQCQKMLALRRR